MRRDRGELAERRRRRIAWWVAFVAIGAVIALLGYSQWRVQAAEQQVGALSAQKAVLEGRIAAKDRKLEELQSNLSLLTDLVTEHLAALQEWLGEQPIGNPGYGRNVGHGLFLRGLHQSGGNQLTVYATVYGACLEPAGGFFEVGVVDPDCSRDPPDNDAYADAYVSSLEMLAGLKVGDAGAPFWSEFLDRVSATFGKDNVDVVVGPVDGVGDIRVSRHPAAVADSSLESSLDSSWSPMLCPYMGDPRFEEAGIWIVSNAFGRVAGTVSKSVVRRLPLGRARPATAAVAGFLVGKVVEQDISELLRQSRGLPCWEGIDGLGAGRDSIEWPASMMKLIRERE